MPIDVTLQTVLGVNSVSGYTVDVAAVASGDYALIRIEQTSILRAAEAVGTPNPVTWDLEILPTEANGVPWYVDTFAFVVAPTGEVIAITFRLHNGGPGNGAYRVKARRPFAPIR